MGNIRATTILAVKRNGKTVIIGDGQATLGDHIILKGSVHKVHRLYEGRVVAGVAGGAADAFAMCEEFEKMLNKYSGSLIRSAVEYAKVLRTQKTEAQMIVADKQNLLIILGAGDVIEPEEGVCSIGSGSSYALSAAKALLRNTDFDARTIALKSMEIATETCVYTNGNYINEEV